MKNKKLIKKVALIMLIVFMALAKTVFAHSGRTDSSGGHKDNQNISGLGSYHYHCGGNPAHLHQNGVCPYSSYTPTSKTTVSETKPFTNYIKKLSEVTSLIIENDTITSIEVGEKQLLSVRIEPEDATNKTITWKSSNSSILKVNNGEIEGIAPGVAEIAATASNGKSTTKAITVEPKTTLVEQIVLSETDISLTEGEEKQITASVLPDNSTNKELKWTSSDPNIVIVKDGKVKAKRKGEVTITVVSDNNIQSYCKITVNPKDIDNSAIEGVASAGIVGGITGLGILGAIGAVMKIKSKM
ncbi:MAG TPA: Ig-like domain-containing protein [Clostridia bacterium]|nr:Ig-like domain-containing protein [Clostridia bacterium]